jgi:hypothetical protein
MAMCIIVQQCQQTHAQLRRLKIRVQPCCFSPAAGACLRAHGAVVQNVADIASTWSTGMASRVHRTCLTGQRQRLHHAGLTSHYAAPLRRRYACMAAEAGNALSVCQPGSPRASTGPHRPLSHNMKLPVPGPLACPAIARTVRWHASQAWAGRDAAHCGQCTYECLKSAPASVPELGRRRLRMVDRRCQRQRARRAGLLGQCALLCGLKLGLAGGKRHGHQVILLRSKVTRSRGWGMLKSSQQAAACHAQGHAHPF